MDTPGQNPIVAMAQRLRARKELGAQIDDAVGTAPPVDASDADARFAALADGLAAGAKRLNAIIGSKNGVTFIRLEKPLRIRLRFRGERVALDLDAARQLVVIAGKGLDGEYQFDAGASVPALINLSLLSTDAGYGDAVTAGTILKTLAADAELPRPAHLDEIGPMRFG